MFWGKPCCICIKEVDFNKDSETDVAGIQLLFLMTFFNVVCLSLFRWRCR